MNFWKSLAAYAAVFIGIPLAIALLGQTAAWKSEVERVDMMHSLAEHIDRMHRD